MMKVFVLRNLFLIAGVSPIATAQAHEGEKRETPQQNALRAARLIDVRDGNTVADAVVLIEGDRIKAVGTNLAIPSDREGPAFPDSFRGRHKWIPAANLTPGDVYEPKVAAIPVICMQVGVGPGFGIFVGECVATTFANAPTFRVMVRAFGRATYARASSPLTDVLTKRMNTFFA